MSCMQECLEYRSKMRLLRVRTLEDSIRVVPVDDSHTVLEVTRTVCLRIGTLTIESGLAREKEGGRGASGHITIDACAV